MNGFAHAAPDRYWSYSLRSRVCTSGAFSSSRGACTTLSSTERCSKSFFGFLGFLAALAARLISSWCPFKVTHLVPLGGTVWEASTLPLRRISKRSEEHTSELQSRGQLVRRLLLE